ncbi:MAG: hypothetical protein K6T65_10430 [Peptococcaceae bacterium]|nr:hypothetical protein [Peptococcaceae bacterium]
MSIKSKIPIGPINIAALETALADFPPGLGFPWPNLQKITRIDPAGLTVVAAGTSHGKSTFGFNLILYYLETTTGTIILWSGEMADIIIFARLISILAGTEFTEVLRQYREGLFSPEVQSARGKMIKCADRLIVLDAMKTGITGADQLAEGLRALSAVYRIELVFIDYLQQLSPPEKRGRYQSREQEVTAVAKLLHEIAVSFRIPVVAFAQISRNNQQYKQKPRLTDLRESGGIEQYAQTVLALWNSSMAGSRADGSTPAAPPDGWYWSEDDSANTKAAVAMAESHAGVLLEVSILKSRLRGHVQQAVPLLYLPGPGRILPLPDVPGSATLPPAGAKKVRKKPSAFKEVEVDEVDDIPF